MRYVWLNINDGRFSNSFGQAEYETILRGQEIEKAAKEGWKLISYQCLNDHNFKFNLNMRLR